MRLIYQGAGLAVVASICVVLSVWFFWLEMDFHTRAVKLQGEIVAVHVRGSHTGARSSLSQPRRVAVQFATPDRQLHRAIFGVSTAYVLEHGVGDKVPVWVDAEDPSNPELFPDYYASYGFYAGAAALIAAVFAALSFATGYQQLLRRSAFVF